MPTSLSFQLSLTTRKSNSIPSDHHVTNVIFINTTIKNQKKLQCTAFYYYIYLLRPSKKNTITFYYLSFNFILEIQHGLSSLDPTKCALLMKWPDTLILTINSYHKHIQISSISIDERLIPSLNYKTFTQSGITKISRQKYPNYVWKKTPCMYLHIIVDYQVQYHTVCK